MFAPRWFTLRSLPLFGALVVALVTTLTLGLASAAWAQTSYTITSSAGSNGGISPAGSVAVDSGNDASFTITPDAGFSILDVMVDGVTAGPLGTYTFSNVTADHTIAASFMPTLNPAVIDAGSPSGTLSSATTTLSVPVTISRDYSNSNRLFHVEFQLGGGLTLAGVTEGGYLASGGGTTNMQVVDSGGGLYTVDGTILGLPCDNTALTGTLFTVAVSSTAPSGTGTLTLTSTMLRDCANDPLASSIGTAASVDIDNTAPVVSVDSPNGTETWIAGSSHAVTWTASDNAAVATIDLAYSTDGGATFPGTIATGLANSGTYAWTLPSVVSSQVRVRATAHDVAGNSASDASDADFAIGQWTLTASAGAGGSISPSGAVGVDEGGSQTFTITPAAGHHITDVLVDGVTVGAVTSYPFTNVTASHTIAASFAIDVFTITSSAGAHGAISPSGPVSVDYDASQAFTITADPTYHVDDVLVDGASVGRVTGYTFTHVDAPHTIAASFAANPAVPAIAALSATQVKTGNDADGTTKITVTWPAVAPGSTVQVYRAGYGNYPEYDDTPGAGSVPAQPAYPPSAPWVLTAITSPGETDEIATRDLCYFVAFVTDSFGTVSPVSNLTAGVLDYYLGDVTDGVTPGTGNNVVNIADVSLLGTHYGLTGAAVTPYAYLDVAPTTNRTVDGRPMTDNLINFEDLVLFAINYNVVSAPQTAAHPMIAAASSDELRLDVPAAFTPSGTLTARLQLRGTGAMLGLSARLAWDPAVVEPASIAPGELADEQGAMTLSAQPGTVDVARMGAGTGLVGEGTLATVTFRRVGEGDPRITLDQVDARDAANGRVAVTFGSAPAPATPAATSFGRITPNPFRAGGTLAFALASGGAVDLALYSVDGRQVRQLVHGARDAGVHQVSWDGRDDSGFQVAAGVYYARLVTPQGSFHRSLVYLK